MSQTAPTPHRPLAEPLSTGTPWLARAVVVSLVLHAVLALVWWRTLQPSAQHEVELVDIEMAPPPPKAEALPAEVAKPPESAPPTNASTDPEDPASGPGEDNAVAALLDAGVDAMPDAALADASVDAMPRKRRPDAGMDAGLDAAVDASMATGMHVATEMDQLRDAGSLELDGGTGGEVAAGAGDAGAVAGASDAGVQVATTESGTGSGSGVGTGSGTGSGIPGATEVGSGSGVAGMDNQPAVEGAATSAGTAANLLSYFPEGHVVTALIRFDRLRKTEWAEPAERLFKPMPDYQALFGTRDPRVADKLDTLVISSPRPQDATATTLVARSAMSRAKLRELLTNPTTPIVWSASKGGMLGKRSGKLFPNDKRVLLSPWKEWFVLAPPDDLPGLTAPAKGSLDTIETRAKLPPWLQTIRTIEKESGEDKPGPALVLTIAGPGKRYDIPDIGLGITSLPSPQRISLAMELVTQGWLIRGNIVFAKEADAAEFESSVKEVQQRITDSRILSGLLRRQHALNLVTGLSVARTGARVSYATSMSISDARALLAAAAATLDAYFAGQLELPVPSP